MYRTELNAGVGGVGLISLLAYHLPSLVGCSLKTVMAACHLIRQLFLIWKSRMMTKMIIGQSSKWQIIVMERGMT
jgi:hypothetical protein